MWVAVWTFGSSYLIWKQKCQMTIGLVGPGLRDWEQCIIWHHRHLLRQRYKQKAKEFQAQLSRKPIKCALGGQIQKESVRGMTVQARALLPYTQAALRKLGCGSRSGKKQAGVCPGGCGLGWHPPRALVGHSQGVLKWWLIFPEK